MQIFLTKVRMINCQSMEDITMEFTNGINIIAGDNSFGKSIFMKMLRLTVFPQEYNSSDRSNIIRYGKDHASIQYFFSDGSDCIVNIYSNKSIYMMRDPQISDSYVSDVTPFPRLINSLSILVDEQERFLPNVFNASKELFLVDSNSRANERLLRASCYNEDLDNLKIMVSDKADYYKEMESDLRNILANYTYNMGDQVYRDTSDWERLIEFSELLVNQLEDCQYIDGLLSSYVTCIPSGKLSVEDSLILLDILDIMLLLDSVTLLDDEYNNTIKDLSNLTGILQLVFDLSLDSSIDVQLIDDLSSMLDLLDLISQFEDESFTEIKDLYELFSIIELLDCIQVVVDYELPIILAEFSGILKEINNLLEDYSSSLRTWNSANAEVAKCEKQMKSFNNIVKCGVYGEVFYIDGQCIPVDNRLT